MRPIELGPAGARALHLHAQGLDRRPRRAARRGDVLTAIRRMAALQIDTIHVVARSPYLVLFSRLGGYDPVWLDEALASGDLFEYWAHEASFLPIESYPLFRHRMLHPATMGWKYRDEWMKAHREEVEAVLNQVRRQGAVRSADFRREDGQGGGWWGWKVEKRILENLFTSGDVMIARRENFQRVYDLRERVHPSWSDDALPSRRDARRELVLRAVRALGVAHERWVADYFRMSKKGTPALAEEMASEGSLLTARIEGLEGPAYVHPDHREAAETAADDRLRTSHTTVLSPFDPVVWDRRRARELFGFDYALECYKPAPQREYGYFVLPILRRGALVGRLDAKAHRRAGRFEVKALWLEKGVRRSAALAADLARALRECARWHGTPEVALGDVAPTDFRRLLLPAIERD